MFGAAAVVNHLHAHQINDIAMSAVGGCVVVKWILLLYALMSILII